jgi:uncharacterized protein (UPF0548 family)
VNPKHLAAAELTYPEHGATRAEPLPAGYHHVHRDVPVGTGRAAFTTAAEALLSWRMHRAAGLSVSASAPTAEPGAVVTMRFGPKPIGLLVPCRVVYRVDEPDARGFAYGTLPGHPERGEEAFVVRLDGDGTVRLVIRAFSRPATLLTRLGAPVARRVQSLVTDRYAAALRSLL